MGLFFLKSGSQGECERSQAQSEGGREFWWASSHTPSPSQMHRVQEQVPRRDLQYLSPAAETTGDQKNISTTLKPQHLLFQPLLCNGLEGTRQSQDPAHG